MAVGGAVLQGLGGVIQAGGALRQGEARYQAAEFNARVAEDNARIAKLQSAEEERRLRVQSRKELGRARASISASGVQLEGSPLEVLQESAANAELDALAIRHRGDLTQQAFRREAAIERFRGQNARLNSRFQAAGLLLGAGGSIGGAFAGGGS